MVRCECVKSEATVGYSSPNAGEWEAVRKVGLDLSSKDGSVYRNVGLHLGESLNCLFSKASSVYCVSLLSAGHVMVNKAGRTPTLGELAGKAEGQTINE